MYYGFAWLYGINITDTNGSPIGRVYSFYRKAERDKWLLKSPCRSALYQKEAIKIMADQILSALECYSYSGDCYYKPWEIVQNVPADVIISSYKSLLKEGLICM